MNEKFENKMYLRKMPPGQVYNYFNYQKKWLWFSGLSVDEKEETCLYKIWSAFMMLNYILMHFILEPFETIMHLHDTEALINLLSYLITDILGNVKIIVMFFNRKKVGKMLKRIETGVFLPNPKRGGEQEISWLSRVILLINRQTILYASAAYVTIWIGLLSTLYQRIYYHHDPTKWGYPYVSFDTIAGRRTPHWEISWVYQGVSRMFLAITLFGIDSLVPGMTAILSVQFKMLHNNLRRLVENTFIDHTGDPTIIKQFPDDRTTVELPQDINTLPKDVLYNSLKDIVEYHLTILKMTEDIEELFNKLVLTVFLSTMFILCFLMFHASMYPLVSPIVLQDICYICFVMIQVFNYCFWGNEVTMESQNVAQAAFDSNFVGSDLRFQKGLALIMQRSLKPVFLTAGKFANLSIQTFVWIMRASYSTYMVLRRSH